MPLLTRRGFARRLLLIPLVSFVARFGVTSGDASSATNIEQSDEELAAAFLAKHQSGMAQLRETGLPNHLVPITSFRSPRYEKRKSGR